MNYIAKRNVLLMSIFSVKGAAYISYGCGVDYEKNDDTVSAVYSTRFNTLEDFIAGVDRRVNEIESSVE